MFFFPSPQEAEVGGFVCGHLSDGSPIYQNPSMPHVLPLLENVLVISRWDLVSTDVANIIDFKMLLINGWLIWDHGT